MTAIHLHDVSRTAHLDHFGLAARLAATLHMWRERGRGRSELARLDARSLHDLGLSSLDVSSEVNKPFWRA